MKYILVVTAIAALCQAQTITDLPSCSLECVASGVTQVGCGLTDFKCSCGKADQLTPNVTPCVQKACSSSTDQEKVITVLEGICKSAGVPITIPKPGASSSAKTSAPTPSATDKVISSSTPSPTGSKGTTSVPSAPYPTGPATSGSSVPSGTGSYSVAPPQFTGAGTAVKVPAGVVGLLGFAAIMV